MSAFDLGVIVAGSRFGNSAAALRATGKGHRAAIPESELCRVDEDAPTSN
jgi:hypothetical protein